VIYFSPPFQGGVARSDGVVCRSVHHASTSSPRAAPTTPPLRGTPLLGFGDANLNVTNGATVNGQGNDLVLGAAASAGFTATTSMLVDSAATVTVRNATLFGAAGSPSTLTIQTSGSQLTASDTLSVVGGTVNVLNNAGLTARNINIQQGGKIVVDSARR